MACSFLFAMYFFYTQEKYKSSALVAIKKAFFCVCAFCQFEPILRAVNQTERLNLVLLAFMKIENPNDCL